MNTPPAALAAPVPVPVNAQLVASRASSAVQVALEGGQLQVALVETAPEVIEFFEHLPGAQRTRLVETAWQSGLRAAMNVHRLASESRLEEIGEEVLDSVRAQLDAHHERQQASLGRSLAEYFDPKDGRLPARIEAFLSDGGELARTMDRFLSDGGELAKTLARTFGDGSPLMKRLSPTDSEGLVMVLEAKLRVALERHGATLTNALDPSIESSPLARFFVKLKTELKAAGEDRDKQLAAIGKMLDANDKTSAMSRFLAEGRAAHQTLLQAMNAEDPTTPLGSIKSALLKLVDQHGKAHQEALALMAERQRLDSQEMREALAKLEVRRRVEARSAAGGASFEDAVVVTLGQLLRGAPLVVEPVGATVGLRPNCKKGDVVIAYGSEHRHAGARVVIEAKHDASYTVPKALAELEIARANRDASVGLFVMARTHATPGFPRFQRFGADVLITWDDGDTGTDELLELAVALTLFMAPLGRRQSEDRADIEALRDLEGRIECELSRYERMRTKVEKIRSHSDDLADELRKGNKALHHLLKSARKALGILDLPILCPDGNQPALQLPGTSGA
jgi:hypothetical protein